MLLTLSACARGPVRQVEPAGPGTETIAIVGTNDLHGELAQIANVGAYVRALRQEWGSSMLWLDAGDALEGTAESEFDHGQAMISFFNSAGLDATVPGDRDLELQAGGHLAPRIAEAHFPFLAANLEGVPGVHASRLFHVGSIRVGVVGITSGPIGKETAPKRREFQATPEVLPQAEILVKEARKLREDGADVVVGLIHAGMFCEPGSASHPMRKPQEPQGACSRSDALSQLLDRVPPGTVDGVVSGHSHTLVHHWFGGTPVIQGGQAGHFVNVLYLSYDRNRHKIVADRGRIEGPLSTARKSLHGKAVSPDGQAQEIAQGALSRAASERAKVVAKAARAIEYSRLAESDMGNLVADAARHALNTDFAMINPGSVRGGLSQGPIRYGELFRALPFENRLVMVELTGEELLTLLKIASNNSRGLMFFSGLELRLLERNADAPSKDLNDDDRISPWEVNRLLEARRADDEPINPKRNYTLATLDFLALGGDNFQWFFDDLSDKRFHKVGPTLRQAVRSYLSDRGTTDVNSSSAPLYSASDARYRFEKTKPKGTKKRSGPKRKARKKR